MHTTAAYISQQHPTQFLSLRERDRRVKPTREVYCRL
jgi:hypothetical protein